MQMSDKPKITIQLAELPKMVLAINREDEEVYRRAERLVNDLWRKWQTSTFVGESSNEVMGRVAFLYATLYVKMEREMQQVKSLDAKLDELLHNLPGLE
jgi:hypothetical protein